MKLIITIDVEEDTWGEYSPTGHTLENVKCIPCLQTIFDKFNVRPTYFINYPVATDDYSVELFSGIHSAGKCEIGMHCHPWNTPPFEEENNSYNSMMSNLPGSLQLKKLKTLKYTIEKNFGLSPTSYRSGRWAFHEASARAMLELGIKVDSSVTAYTDWSSVNGVDYSDISPAPYRFAPDDILKRTPQGPLLQVPATVGYLKWNLSYANWVDKCLKGKLGRMLRLKGILHRLGVLNKVNLSPESASCKSMKKLVDALLKTQIPVVNMFFHSTALQPGLSPFTSSTQDVDALMGRIEEMLVYFEEKDFESITLNQFEMYGTGDI